MTMLIFLSIACADLGLLCDSISRPDFQALDLSGSKRSKPQHSLILDPRPALLTRRMLTVHFR